MVKLGRGLGVIVLVLSAVSVAGACKRDGGVDVATPDDEPKPKKKKDPVKAFKEPKNHRAEHASCPSADTPAPGTVTYGPKMATPPGPPCKSKADCKARPNGRCSLGNCTYDDCYEDKDCKGGTTVCTCQQEGERGYYCKAGDCAVDADCKGGGYCSPSWSMTCGSFMGTVGYYCHTKDDECTNDDECTKGKEQGYCAYDSEKKHWRCGFGHCVG